MNRLHAMTAADVRLVNRSAVLETLRREGPVSRTQIAEKLSISVSSVRRIIDDLEEEGIIRPRVAGKSSEGCRHSLPEFNPDGNAVIGLDLGGTKLFGAIADLNGSILEEIELSHHGTSGDESYNRLAEMLETLLASHRLVGRRILGVGVGTPGITLYEEGIVSWAPSLKWRDFPLRARLAEQFRMPVVVENDVNLAALGELWFGAGQSTGDMVLIAIGTGIGSGVILDGALYRGFHAAAGEIGYLLPGREFLGKRYTGFGALEGMASGTGIAERARKMLKERLSSEELTRLTAAEVFDAARRRESWAVDVLEETLDFLSIMLVGVIACIDPELIVLGGGVARSADLLLEPLKRRIEGIPAVVPSIAVSTLGYRATVLGAIPMILHGTPGGSRRQ
jgi:glucokinase